MHEKKKKKKKTYARKTRFLLKDCSEVCIYLFRLFLSLLKITSVLNFSRNKVSFTLSEERSKKTSHSTNNVCTGQPNSHYSSDSYLCTMLPVIF